MNEDVHIRASREFEADRRSFALREAVDRALSDAFAAAASAMIIGVLVACVRNDSLRYLFSAAFFGAAAWWVKAAWRLRKLKRLLNQSVFRKDILR